MTSETQFTPQMIPTEMNAQEMLCKVVANSIESGAFEKAITIQVEKMIDETAKNVFRSYSDLGKALEEKLTKSFMPSLEKMGDLPSYHEFVTNRLKLAAEKFYNEKLTAVLDKELAEIMSEVPDEMTLSYLVEKLKESKSEDEPQGAISLHISERSHGQFFQIYIDEDENVLEGHCQYDLHLTERSPGYLEIIGLRIRGRKAGEQLTFGNLYGVEKLLFNLYATGGLIHLDEGEYEGDYDVSWDHY